MVGITASIPTISFDDELLAAQNEYAEGSTELEGLTLENAQQDEYAEVDFADADGSTDTPEEIDQEAKLVAATAKELFDKSVEELNDEEKMLLEKFLLEASGEDGKFDETEWANFNDVFAEPAGETDDEKADVINNEVAQTLYGKDFDDLTDTEKADVESVIAAADQDGEAGLSDAEMQKLKAVLATTKDEDDSTVGNLTEQILETLAGLSPVPIIPIQQPEVDRAKQGDRATQVTKENIDDLGRPA